MKDKNILPNRTKRNTKIYSIVEEFKETTEPHGTPVEPNSKKTKEKDEV